MFDLPPFVPVLGSWDWIVQWLVKIHRPPSSTEVDEETAIDPPVAAFEALLADAHRAVETERGEKAAIEEQLVKERTCREEVTKELGVAAGELHAEREKRSRAQKDLHDVRIRHETESAELRKARVLLECEKQELVEVKAEVGRLKETAQQRDHDSLLLRGLNVQARFPTLPEIEARIGGVLKGIVREWVYQMSTTYCPPLIDVPILLAQVFLECQALVMRHHHTHTAYFHGKMSCVEGGESDAMQEEVETFMLKHLRRHYLTLYPLSPGQDFDKAIQHVMRGLATMLSRRHNVHSNIAFSYLSRTGIEGVIEQYLSILVCVTLHPPAAFSDCCGCINPFNKKTHNHSIDGDAVRSGGPCVVVFPTLVGELEAGQGSRPIGKKYILPAQDPSGVPGVESRNANLRVC